MNPATKQRLLQHMAAISAMERGKLSAYAFKERSGGGPYHKLQRWEEGKNVTRYVPADEVAEVEAALAGYEQYRQLSEEYARLVIAETRQSIALKKKSRSRPRSSWPKTRKSSA
jgi:hypothetical protein